MMRPTLMLMASLAALAAAGPAWAEGKAANPAQTDQGLPDDVEVVPAVNPGDQIGIACSALTRSDADSDVRVVLTISAAPGEIPPGYAKVLATDAEVAHGAVRVRIPTVPDLENHTVSVNVYVVGEKGAQNCDAGHVKIVGQPPAHSSIG
jgi:hypothetical protein